MAKAPHGKNEPPKVVIVKKITVVAGGHHGGAWKVAYADFVTAMMAFFLLLWLLGATTEKQRKGLADYFAPTLLDTRSLGVGGGGPFGGESLLSTEKLGPKAGQANLQAIAMPTETGAGNKAGYGSKGSLRSRDAIVAQDKKNFAKLKADVMRKIAEKKELAKLGKHIRFTMTEDGMRIDLIDDADYSMFALGTTALDKAASDLIGMVAKGIQETSNPIMIRGHTDSLPFGEALALLAAKAGVVIDDAAVTPRYVVGFAAERELPIVGKIALGSLRNKLLFLLPGALALSAFAPWAITPLLMLGGPTSATRVPRRSTRLSSRIPRTRTRSSARPARDMIRRWRSAGWPVPSRPTSSSRRKSWPSPWQPCRRAASGCGRPSSPSSASASPWPSTALSRSS